MKIEKAVKVLELHNKWRRGAEIEMQSPKTLSEAINTVVSYFKQPQKEGITDEDNYICTNTNPYVNQGSNEREGCGQDCSECDYWQPQKEETNKNK